MSAPDRFDCMYNYSFTDFHNMYNMYLLFFFFFIYLPFFLFGGNRGSHFSGTTAQPILEPLTPLFWILGTRTAGGVELL